MKIKHTAILIAGLLVWSITNQAIPINNLTIKNINILRLPFSGIWRLEPEQSAMGQMPLEFAFDVVELKQTKDSITIRRSSPEILKNGEKYTVQTSSLTGSSSYFRYEKTKRTKSSVISINKEGNQITETATFKYDNKPVEAYQLGYVETFTLSADAKMMTVIREMKISNERANWTTKCIYKRGPLNN